MLRFESVHHRAAVYLDGKPLGRHVGVYLPFEHRVRLEEGRSHTLVVRADYRGPTDQKRSGWHRTWFNFGGINREVTIRPAAPSEITAPTVQTRLGSTGAVVDVTAHVRNETAQAREIRVRGTLSREGRRHDLRFPSLVVAPNETKVFHAQVNITEPAYWEPGSPNLYDLELEVPDETAYHVKTGLRELSRQGSRVYLNGRRLSLHGASIHEDVRNRGDALTPEDMDRIVASLSRSAPTRRACSTRSTLPCSSASTRRGSSSGRGSARSTRPAPGPTRRPAAGQRAARARKSYFQTQPHPSVIAWNLANEVAGNGHPDGQASYIDFMARELRRRDPGRLIAVDVWGAHPPKRGSLGKLYRNVDSIAITNYVGWYEIPLAPRREISRRIRKRTRQFLDTFPGKVVVISEFGAEANRLNNADKPGGMNYQAWLLSEHIEAYRELSSRLSGMLVWNLRDFAVSPAFFGGSINNVVPGIRIVRGINQKGLFDYDGDPKPSVAAVRRAFAGLGNGLTDG